MVAADILVTKAGPGTIAEACCCQTPILLFDYLPGQEEGNVTFVCEHGIGEEEKVAGNVALHCLEWLRDPAKLAAFKHAAGANAQPTSAIDIARTTLEILQGEAHLNELEARAEADGAADGCSGDGEEGDKRASTLGRSFSEGDLKSSGGEDETKDHLKYKYVYRTSWWSWLSPFNHERAPSWWRESRVPDDSSAAPLESEGGLFPPVLPVQEVAAEPAGEPELPPPATAGSPQQ